jgi:hypothetical protein
MIRATFEASDQTSPLGRAAAWLKVSDLLGGGGQGCGSDAEAVTE